MDDRPLNAWAGHFRDATDDEVRSPLWNYPPAARPAQIHERRRRFGVDDDSE